MTLSQLAAVGSRREEKTRDFAGQTQTVSAATQDEATPNRPSNQPGTAWKSGFFAQLAAKGPGRMSRNSILMSLARIADRNGQTSISIASLAERANGSDKAVRKNVHFLAEVEGVWLRKELMTWGELEKRLPGWKRPPHAEPKGTATYLFTLLDGSGRPAAETFARKGPGLRTASPRRPGGPGIRHTAPSGAHTSTTNPGDEGTEAATPAVAPEPVAAPATASAPEPATATAREPAPPPPAAPAERKVEPWERGFSALVEAHAKRATDVYHVRPTPPKMPLDERKAMGECVASSATTLAARVHERTKIVLSHDDALEQLAAQVMLCFFKRPGANNFLLNSRHRLRSLYEELDARISEAMTEILSRFVQAAPPPPRRTLAEDAGARVARQVLGSAFGQMLERTLMPGTSRTVHELPRYLQEPADQHDENSLDASSVNELALDEELVDAPAAKAPPHLQVAVLEQRAEDAHRERRAKPLISPGATSPDIEPILEAFASRPMLQELREHAALATELLLLARDRGKTLADVIAALDEANEAASMASTPVAKTSAVYKSVVTTLFRLSRE